VKQSGFEVFRKCITWGKLSARRDDP